MGTCVITLTSRGGREREVERGKKRVVGPGITTASPFPLPVGQYGQSSHSHYDVCFHCTTTSLHMLYKACFVMLIPVTHTFFSEKHDGLSRFSAVDC